jgi:hypothetical protein
MSETHNHVVLKQKAIEWLYLAEHCRYIASEIKIGRHIFDVVGSDGKRVFIVEAKQDHADFLADCNDPAEIKQQILENKKLMRETGEFKKHKIEINKLRDKSTKFKDDSLTRLASHRYIIAPEFLIANEEVPANWGLLCEDPRIIVKCEGDRIDKKYVGKVIREIARKQTKNFLEQHGVQFRKVTQFPKTALI